MRWMPLLVVMFACGDKPEVHPDGPAPDTAMPDGKGIVGCDEVDPMNMPTLLDTCLCEGPTCDVVQSGIKAYEPQFELYSDGATKRRWIWLPPDTKIDSSDMDFWQFPVGTKVWKEFTRDGVRVETRLVMRIADNSPDPDNDWFYVAYVWNAAQDATTAEPFGVPDANGTMHDVPTRANCKTCHNNLAPSRVLGFSAIQLDWDNPVPDTLDLQALVDANLLTTPPAGATTPRFPLPGNTTEKAALAYMHANCGHCHNPSSRITLDNGVQMQLRLTVGTLGSVAATPAYTTAIGIDGTTSGINGIKRLVEPGMPDQSQVTVRFETDQIVLRMPALGTEIMDMNGDTILRDWITNLP